MRVPLSGLAYIFAIGVNRMVEYSAEGTCFPICKASGRIMVALAPPNSRAEIREGRTRWLANSGGKIDAESLRVLNNTALDG